MSIVSPWILLALGALAVPVWVHLSRRQDEQRQAFPSTMFINRLAVTARARKTLRDRFLFALRCLAIALLVLAFATPFFPQSADTASQGAAQDTVLLVDTSYSMGVANRFEDALKALDSRIDSTAASTRLALVTFDQTPRVISDLTEDHAAISAAVAGLTTNDRATRLDLAFAEATRILQTSDAARKTVVLFSDLQRSALESSESLRLPDDAVLDVERFDAAPGANLAVTNVVIEAIENETAAVSLIADVRNTGSEAMTDIGVRFFADDRQLAEQTLSLAPGSKTTAGTRLVLSRDRPVRVRVEVDADSVANDNTYHMVAARGRRLTVLVVEPVRAHRHQSVYIREALGVGGLPGIDAVTESTDAFANRSGLDGIDVVILNDVALTEGKARRTLDDFVQNGGGLLTVAGENTRFIAHPDEDLILTEFDEQPRANQNTNAADGHAIADARADHPTQLDVFIQSGAALSQVRIRHRRTLEETAKTTTLAELDDGTPLILESAFGGGRHLIVMTTLDPRWSNLALEPGFVPTLHRLVDYLADRTATRPGFLTGETIDLARHGGAFAGAGRWRSTLAAGSAIVEDPEGNAHTIAANTVVFRPRQPGLHELHDPGGGSIPIAVNTSREESLFLSADSDELRQRLMRTGARTSTVKSAGATGQATRYPLGWYLLLLAALFFAAENVVANILTERRAGTRQNT